MALREPTQQDMQYVIDAVGSEEACYLWSGPTFSYPLDEQQLQTHYAKDAVIPYIFEHAGQVIGYIELYKVSRWHYRLCRVLIFSSFRGQGWSKSMLEEAIGTAYYHYHALTVSLAVFERNYIALRCYRDLGFRVWSVDRTTRIFQEEIWPLVRMKRNFWQRRLKQWLTDCRIIKIVRERP